MYTMGSPTNGSSFAHPEVSFENFAEVASRGEWFWFWVEPSVFFENWDLQKTASVFSCWFPVQNLERGGEYPQSRLTIV